MTVTLTANFGPPRALLRLVGALDIGQDDLRRRLDDAAGLGCNIELDARAVSAIDEQSVLVIARTTQSIRRNGCRLWVVASSVPFRRAARWAGVPFLLDGPPSAGGEPW
jgi:hypothetical protein